MILLIEQLSPSLTAIFSYPQITYIGSLEMPPRKQIAQAVWDSYFEELKELYITQDKGLSDIMCHMNEKYGFDAGLVSLFELLTLRTSKVVNSPQKNPVRDCL